ncbi:sperm microtubule inner protein 8 isoform X2 [Ambystoma mexicanum]|uniref:sperm microtubule inner protein 8 isoform X2 n=1 Tax=Ambystoma mexicanum TaxID=8296 RepID=UPI0037E87580
MAEYQTDGRWGQWGGRQNLQPKCKTHMLAGVKSVLYHPLLPTIRRMEADSISGKLSDEHSRTTTCCTKEDFDRAAFTCLEPPKRRFASLEVTDTGRQFSKRCGMGTMAPLPPGITSEEWPSYTQAASDWSHFISTAKEFTLPDPKRSVLSYSGYAVRYLKPGPTQTWRECVPHVWLGIQPFSLS